MGVSRRDFLKFSGAAFAGAVALKAPLPAQASAEIFPGYPDRFGMLTDTTKCIGCRMCEAACAQANSLPKPSVPFTDQSVFNAVRRPDTGVYTVVNSYSPGTADKPVFRKIQCLHCNEPACVSACLVGALKKTPEGSVLYDESLCIGCRYCMNACPHTMLSYSYSDPIRPAINKCTMCYKRISAGGVPACAEICPTKGTIFGKRSDLLEIARDRIKTSPDKYVPHIYGENEAGGTSWLYLSAVPFEQLGLVADLGTTPYPEYTRDFLMAVPLVIILWPTLLMGIRRMTQRREVIAKDEPANKGGK